MARLAGKTAIVTGGAKGIGRHYSQALAAEGARVMIADIADGKELAAEIAGRHGANCGGERHLRRQRREGGQDCWWRRPSNASARSTSWSTTPRSIRTLQAAQFRRMDADLWDKVMAINMRGPFLMVKHVAPHMIARRTGKIINIASGAAYKGVPRMLPYVTSKGAMLAFTRSLSRELGQHGIAVNSLSPGYILSDTGLENAHPRRGRAHPGAQFARLQARRLSRKTCSAR